jgi:hypothetical protein
MGTKRTQFRKIRVGSTPSPPSVIQALIKFGVSQRSAVPIQPTAHLFSGAVHDGACCGLLEASQQLLWVRGSAVHPFADCKGLASHIIWFGIGPRIQG